MDVDQTNSMTEEKVYDPSLQAATKQRTLLQTFMHIYHGSILLLYVTATLCSFLLFIYSCVSPSLRIFALLYVSWMYYDRRTPHTGGRRWSWIKKSSIWGTMRDYFPVKLIKVAELPPNTTYMIAAFPHGILPIGLCTDFGSDLAGFVKAFPGLTLYMHGTNIAWDIPVVREVLMALGGVTVSPESILHTLNGPPGNAAVLFPGGFQEMMKSSPGGKYRIVLKNRKGFVKLALKTGSSLVPVFGFGETDSYHAIKWYRSLQKKIVKSCPLARLAVGRGPCKLGYLFGILPYQNPITSVGSPIKLPKVADPSDELVDKFHEIFMQELTALFENYKVKYDSRGKEATLIIE